MEWVRLLSWGLIRVNVSGPVGGDRLGMGWTCGWG